MYIVVGGTSETRMQRQGTGSYPGPIWWRSGRVCSPVRTGMVDIDHLWEGPGSLGGEAILGCCLLPCALLLIS